MVTKEKITTFFKALQDDICQQLEQADGLGRFREDQWTRPGGGGGRSRVIEGQVIEKGGVNFSAVEGQLPEKISQALGLPASNFFATGVSIVLHPINPMVPIIHMNVRYFETVAAEGSTWWFGGGIDLTPHYIFKEDAQFFHQSIKHRKETRGIGGIFFDRLGEEEGITKEDRFNYVQAVGNSFCPIYLKLIDNNQSKPYTEQHQEWQFMRRGRYVEFNLVWDRGTKFGLDTDGRTESILMSMPPRANWVYNYQVEEGSAEAETQNLLRKGIDWTKFLMMNDE